MAGITTTGFEAKTLDTIRTELIQAIEAEIGQIDASADSAAGVIIGAVSKGHADLWEGLQAVYNSFYPSSASGVSLDNVADLSGIQRLAATKTTGNVQVKGDIGTVLSAGRVVSAELTGNRFTNDNPLTIDASIAVQAEISITTAIDSTDYTVTINGTPSTFNSGIGATAISIAAGLVAQIITDAEPVTPTDNLDGSFTLDTDDITVTFSVTVGANISLDKISNNMPVIAEEFGVVQGLAGTVIVIETPVSGWDSVSNAVDLTEGRNDETDSELRARRAQSLQVVGAGTVEAIRSRLLQVDNVTGAIVEENATDATDGSGRPPHSFEAIVAGGLDQDIADLIWLIKPAGIATHGTETVSVTDSQGFSHDVKFSRATSIYLWVKVTLTFYSEESYPTDGDDQVAAAVLAFGDTHEVGNDVIPQRFFGSIYEIPGIENVVVEIATSATAGGPPGAYQTTKLSVSNTEVAVFDSARITIV